LFGAVKFVVVWGVVFAALGLAMTGAVTLLADDSAEPAADSAADGDAWGSPEPVSNETTAAYEAAIHEEINAVRTTEGHTALTHRDDLAAVARGHSRDMATRSFFAHENPDGDSVNGRLDAAGVACRAAGENIAKREPYAGTPDELADEIVGQWMASPGHRDNILRDRWTAEGIGVYATTDEVWVTQVFC